MNVKTPFILIATLCAFTFSIQAQTEPTCPGTGYCLTSLHSEFADLTGAIGSVKFAGINNPQVSARNAVPPTDANCEPGSATVKAGEEYEITVKGDTSEAGIGESNFYAVWIDFNQDGIFDENEYVAGSEQHSLVFKAMIRISGSAKTGKTRMRIRSNYQSDPPITAEQSCTELFYGETEDYEVTILPCPADPAEITAEGPTYFCVGDSVKLTASEGAAYRWNTGDTTRSIIAKESMIYEVTVTNAVGCRAIDTMTVTSVNCPPPTGMSTLLQEKINIWPNPTAGIIHITSQLPKGMISSLEVLNMFGQLIKKEPLDTYQPQQLDLSHHPDGVYYIRLNGKDFSLMRKIILQ